MLPCEKLWCKKIRPGWFPEGGLGDGQKGMPCNLNGVQYRLIPTHPNHHGITYSIFYHDTQRLSGVVAGMTLALRVPKYT